MPVVKVACDKYSLNEGMKNDPADGLFELFDTAETKVL